MEGVASPTGGCCGRHSGCSDSWRPLEGQPLPGGTAPVQAAWLMFRPAAGSGWAGTAGAALWFPAGMGSFCKLTGMELVDSRGAAAFGSLGVGGASGGVRGIRLTDDLIDHGLEIGWIHEIAGSGFVFDFLDDAKLLLQCAATGLFVLVLAKLAQFQELGERFVVLAAELILVAEEQAEGVAFAGELAKGFATVGGCWGFGDDQDPRELNGGSLVAGAGEAPFGIDHFANVVSFGRCLRAVLHHVDGGEFIEGLLVFPGQ